MAYISDVRNILRGLLFRSVDRSGSFTPAFSGSFQQRRSIGSDRVPFLSLSASIVAIVARLSFARKGASAQSHPQRGWFAVSAQTPQRITTTPGLTNNSKSEESQSSLTLIPPSEGAGIVSARTMGARASASIYTAPPPSLLHSILLI